MFSLSHFLLQRGKQPLRETADCFHDQKQTTPPPGQESDISSTRISDVTEALQTVNSHPFRKFSIRQIECGHFPASDLGRLSRRSLSRAVTFVMKYYDNSSNFQIGLRRSDNSEYLCRELFIASHNGLCHLSDIFSYDAICHRRVIREIAQNVLRPVLPPEMILQENELVCHEIAEFIGAHVFLRCATLKVPLECRSRPSFDAQAIPTVSTAPFLFRSPAVGTEADLASDWSNGSIGYASSGLESEDDERDLSRLRGARHLLHAVSPPPETSYSFRARNTRSPGHPIGEGPFNFVSPRPLRLVRSLDPDVIESTPSLESTSPPELSGMHRSSSQSSFQSGSTPQPSLHRSTSSNAHNFASTSMRGFGEEKELDDDGAAGAGSKKRTRRHHTFVLSDSHGRVLRHDIFAANWEEFDVMFWRGVRMCDVTLLVDEDLNLYTRMPHRRMWFTPTAPSMPPYLPSPYAPLYQFYVKKWHFSPRNESSGIERFAKPISRFYTLCADSQGVSSALAYALPISMQTTHEYLFGNERIREQNQQLFCAIDEPSAVFDAHASDSNPDTSFSCSSTDDFHTALVIEKLEALHPGGARQFQNVLPDRQYLYFEDQVDCENVSVTRCCEWNFPCRPRRGECTRLFVASCYDSLRPFLLFSTTFPSVRRAKEHVGNCRRVFIPQLDPSENDLTEDELEASMNISKIQFKMLSAASADGCTCGRNDGQLFLGVQYVNPIPDIAPHASSNAVFVPNSTRVVIYKHNSNFEIEACYTIGQSNDGRDLSMDIGVVFVLEDMVVTHEFVYVLLSAEAHPHFLGRRLSTNPWMQLPHHDDAMSSSSDEHESSERHFDTAHVSDEDEEDDSPRFRNVDNRWRVILRTSDLSFVCMEPDRVQFPGALLGSVVPIEAFDV